jgi:hypothetical protein
MYLTCANQFINKHSCHYAPSPKFTTIYEKLCDFSIIKQMTTQSYIYIYIYTLKVAGWEGWIGCLLSDVLVIVVFLYFLVVGCICKLLISLKNIWNNHVSFQSIIYLLCRYWCLRGLWFSWLGGHLQDNVKLK